MGKEKRKKIAEKSYIFSAKKKKFCGIEIMSISISMSPGMFQGSPDITHIINTMAQTP